MSGDTKLIDADDKDFKENINVGLEGDIESSKYETETQVDNKKKTVEEENDKKPSLVENSILINNNDDDGDKTNDTGSGDYLNLNNADENEISNNLKETVNCENENTNYLNDDGNNKEPLPFDVTEDCKRFILSKECTYINDRFFKTKFNNMDLIVDNRTGYFNGTTFCLPLKLNINDWIENDRYFIDFEKHCREELKVPFIYHVIDQTDPILNGVYTHMAGLNIFLSWA